jgi:hypothetical protein
MCYNSIVCENDFLCNEIYFQNSYHKSFSPVRVPSLNTVFPIAGIIGMVEFRTFESLSWQSSLNIQIKLQLVFT